MPRPEVTLEPSGSMPAEGEALEEVFVDIHRASDGQIIVEADYEYPLP